MRHDDLVANALDSHYFADDRAAASEDSAAPLLSHQDTNNNTTPTCTQAHQARFSWRTVRNIHTLISFASPQMSDAIFLILILSVIIVYMLLGNQVLLAPGRVYNALIATDMNKLYSELRFYTGLLVVITCVRVLRGVLTDALAIRLRSRLSARVHAHYMHNPPTLLHICNHPSLDNPDQRAVADSRDFCDSLLDIMAGSAKEASGGAFEALVTIAWYSVQVATRAGPRSVLLAYAWSSLAASASAVSVTYVARARVRSESAEARLRFAHAELRADARSVAFEGKHSWRRIALDTLLGAAVSARWAVLKVAAPLAAIDHGFAYCVSIVMYGAIAFSISTGGYFTNFTAGEKAQYVSQTGSVFMQLLYAFTMLVTLSPKLARFVSQTHRVHQLIAEHPVESKPPAEHTPQIVLQHLSVRLHDGRLTAPLNLSIQRGEHVLLSGPSGCGKTSALLALRGLANAGIHTGTAHYPLGTEFVAQGARLPPGLYSLRELVVSPAAAVGDTMETDAVRAALQSVGWNRSNELDRVREWSTVLSPGERQLVAMAGVIVRRAQFAVLDEPTSALDATSEQLCMRALRESGMGLLTVAHGGRMAALHDRIVRMGEPSGSARGDAGASGGQHV